MKTAVVIITHKRAAEAMIEVAEMICGNQDNMAAIEFHEHEDMSGLIENCRLEMGKLDTEKGVLFLVDLFGGTPFNAACTIAGNHPKQAVLAGVNVPMLIEVFVSRENMDLDELCEAAGRSAVEGVRRAVRVAGQNEDDE